MVRKQEVQGPVLPDTEKDTTTQLRNEYMQAQVNVGVHYSVDGPGDPVDVTGGAADEPEISEQIVAVQAPPVQRRHFEVLQIAHSHSRAHVMHTCESAEDTALVAPLAFQVVFEAERTPAEDEQIPRGTVHVHSDSEPTWVQPRELALWESFSKALSRWEPADTPSPPGCIALCKQTRARPPYAITDDRCPTLALSGYLKQKGWKSVPQLVVHTAPGIGWFDGVPQLKMKRYLQVLTRLPEALALCPSIPSRQPVGFYKLLLNGHAVVPNKSQ